ncbi:MAG: response regulator [Pantanalinema sp. GBBB05]|nr:response regulator [Pantanalinema sp. GBBB05]
MFDIGSIVNTPYLSNGRWVFDLGVARSKPSIWREDEIGLLRELSARIWLRIERARAEEALRESEAKYRSLFTSMDEGYFLCDVIFDETDQPIDLFYIDENSAAIRMTGQSFRGRRLKEINPNYEDYWCEIFGRVAQTGHAERLERYAAPDQIWYDFYVFKAGGHDTRRVAVVFNDITDRKRRELNTAFLDEIGKELSVLSAPDEIIQTVGVRLREFLQASSCIFADLDEAKNEATIHHGWNTTDVVSLKQTFRLADYFGDEFARAGRAGETVIVRDTAQDERLNAEAYAQLKIGSFVTVPFQRNRCWTANITVTTREPRDWREDEIRLLQEIINRVFPRIERSRAEEALRESEARYRSLFDSMDEGFCIIEKVETDTGQPSDFRYLTVNPAFERHTGIPDVVGKTVREFVPNVEQSIIDRYDAVVRTGEPQQFLDYLSDLDIWIEAEVFPTQKAGQIAVLFSNVSERKRAEIQVRRAAEMDAFRVKLSDALRSLADPLVVQEVACRVLGEHLGANRVLYSEMFESLGSQTLIRVSDYTNGVPSRVGWHRLDDFGEFVLETWRAGRNLLWSNLDDLPNLSADERAAYEAVEIEAIIGVPLVKEGRFEAFLAVHQATPRQWTPDEIALVEETAERTWAAVERARAEANLREAEVQRVREQSEREKERQRAETLADLDRAKTTFFSNISHEFRTPLTLSLAPLQDALSDRTLPAIQRERLELVHRNNLRLLKLVNTLLDFSRIEAGRMEAVYEPTDLATFTTDLASVFRSAIERAGLQLIVDCPLLPQPVFVDREMWEKIVLNLLSNAFKFTFTGEIRLSLHSTDGNQAILQIQDTGTGIAPEHLPHLFERFYQVRGTQARTHEGSGIGLALVHELVQLQGGTIEVSSTVGEGTCFTITLPFGTEHLPSDRLQDEGDRIQPTRTLASTAMGAASYVEEAERWLPNGGNRAQPIGDSEEQPVQTAASLSKLSSAHVLLVDDNADMREYLTRILSEHVQVEAVADGATALTVAQERVPDLILSDVMMPGLDGFELLQALRANPQTREVPIILLSARAGEEAIVEGLEAGADDYLIKPFSAQELISRVTTHLQTSQSRGEALQQARSTLRSRDEFISVVSHELNTPLVSILGWTRMLRSSPPNPVMLNKALDTIERNATLQGKLVQDLLDLSRITAGKLRLNPQPIELKPVIETAIATVTQTAADKGVNLTWQENATEPVVVMGDSDRLCQVICNLLTNAIKFTPESGNVRVELSLINDDSSANTSYAEIRVTDTGIGIAADFLPYVFDRFRQAEGTHSAKGLGLGLAIARHIVELHGGSIHAASAGEGQGTTFTVRLPLLRNEGSI